MKTAPDSRYCPGGIDWNECPGIWRDPERMSGAWCIDQGRVQLASMFTNMGSGMTVEEFIDTFGAIKHEDVTSVLRHIVEQLRKGTTNPDSPVPGRGAIDWREHKGIEFINENHSNEWVFKGTQRRIADLFEHIAEGGTIHNYCERFDEVQRAETEELMDFLAARLIILGPRPARPVRTDTLRTPSSHGLHHRVHQQPNRSKIQSEAVPLARQGTERQHSQRETEMSAEPDNKHCPGGIDWNACPGIWRNPKRMSGAWCFKRGRVPLSSLFENVGSGMTVEEFIDTFGGIDLQDVTAALRHISEQLRKGTETNLYSNIPEGGAIDWRDYQGIETINENQSHEWVFKGTQRRIAELFEHLSKGETTHDYCEQFNEVQAADAKELMRFLAARLNSM